MTNTPDSSTIEPACALFEERLAAYLERDLDAAARDEMERHRGLCSRCALLAQDYESIAASAARLPGLMPSRDLWAGISDRIAAPTVELFQTSGVDPVSRSADGAVSPTSLQVPSRRGVSVHVLALAATMLITVSSAITWRLARSSSDATATVALDSGSTSRDDLTLVTNPNVVYEQEISALRTIVDARFTELDSATVAILQRNLAIIDAAIAESRQALDADPSSRALSTALERAVESKLALMRRVALL